MAQLEIGRDGTITLPQHFLEHLGVDGEAELTVEFLAAKTIQVRLSSSAISSSKSPDGGSIKRSDP